jgi:3'-phosphoadenosine 5'-phosphosulfate sulfotransferase (PAPS reductase)/FAD synthetase
MRDPFRIEGPAIISFSGGRTSGYMLWRILQAWGRELPADVHVCFANTGKEMPQTLDFVRDCDRHWGVAVHWLEYGRGEVNYATASRNGEPYKALIGKRGYLPNPVTRFCTVELKIRCIGKWAKDHFGHRDFDQVLGLRVDEAHRAAKALARAEFDSEYAGMQLPLYRAGVTKRDVQAFWLKQNFDLRLPNINGATPFGNCDLCFLKSAATISGIMREQPELARWWIEAEAEARANKPSGARFRADRPSYAQMLDTVQRQGNIDFGDLDQRIDCFCSEDQA